MSKNPHSGSMGVMATSGPPEHARLTSNKTTMRLSNKFEQNAGGSSGVGYGAIGNVASLHEGAHSSFEHVQPQMLSNQ